MKMSERARDDLAGILAKLIVQVAVAGILIGFYRAGYPQGATFAAALLVLLDQIDQKR